MEEVGNKSGIRCLKCVISGPMRGVMHGPHGRHFTPISLIETPNTGLDYSTLDLQNSVSLDFA